MSLPETCPFCGAGARAARQRGNGSERWVSFDCFTQVFACDPRPTQSESCKSAERTRLAARVAELEAENKSLRAAGDALARHVAEDARGQTARRLVEAWAEASR